MNARSRHMVGLITLGASIGACDTYVTVSRDRMDAAAAMQADTSPPQWDAGRDSAPDAFTMPPCGDAGGTLDLANTTRLDDSDPPIAGGTLLVTHDGRFAVASDPDVDSVFVVERATHTARRVALSANDEPGRLVEDGAGLVHVVLRRSGVVATIDPALAALVRRDSVCANPRGIGFDATSGRVAVACLDGHVVTMPAAGGGAQAIEVDGDLRDVVFDATGAMFLTTFRSVGIRTAATMTGPITAHEVTAPMGTAPTVAWRAVPVPGGGILVVHQLASVAPIDLGSACPGAYGGLDPIVRSAMTLYRGGDTAPEVTSIDGMPLPVDVAISPSGTDVAVAAAGNGLLGGASDVGIYTHSGNAITLRTTGAVTGQAIAVAFTPDGSLVVQTRAPATLVEGFGISVVELGDARRPGTGHSIFHTATSAHVACASCHPEGDDDGHVWSFDRMGNRRTQTFRGGFLATAPFHWDGSLADMPSLVRDVYVHRMGGGQLDYVQTDALSAWIDRLPLLPQPVPVDPSAVARGRALFENPVVACATCHTGELLTNNATVDVGTGGAMQVPSLRGLRWRAPYMHTGCAATLAARFDPACGGGESHGHTAALSETQRADLIAYLQSL